MFTRNKINLVPSFSTGRMGSGRIFPILLLPIYWSCRISRSCLGSLIALLAPQPLHSCLHHDPAWKGITLFAHTNQSCASYLPQGRENWGCTSWWVEAVINRPWVQLCLLAWELQQWDHILSTGGSRCPQQCWLFPSLRRNNLKW